MLKPKNQKSTTVAIYTYKSNVRHSFYNQIPGWNFAHRRKQAKSTHEYIFWISLVPVSRLHSEFCLRSNSFRIQFLVLSEMPNQRSIATFCSQYTVVDSDRLQISFSIFARSEKNHRHHIHGRVIFVKLFSRLRPRCDTQSPCSVFSERCVCIFVARCVCIFVLCAEVKVVQRVRVNWKSKVFLISIFWVWCDAIFLFFVMWQRCRQNSR